MNSPGSVFLKGKQLLETAGIESAAFDAACLFEDICGISRSMIAFAKEPLLNADKFLDACQKRAGGYPLQYILGSWEFYGFDFKVSPAVLIPRADTETLVDYFLQNHSGEISVLDICCGSGCIGIAIKKLFPRARVTLCDISEQALKVAAENAKALSADVEIVKADLLKGGNCYFEKEEFDVIISNPPYIKSGDMQNLSKEVGFEPTLALDGGEDGMKFYTALASGWQDTLKKGGEMVFEAGFDTGRDIVALFTELGYCDINTKKDLNNITRVVSAKKA